MREDIPNSRAAAFAAEGPSESGQFLANEVGGRATIRHRRIAAAAGTALAAKLISVSVGLLTVPLTLHYLGPERYGMWLIMSSFVALLSFADMGIGNGLLNTVAAAFGRDDSDGIRVAVSSGVAVLTVLAVVIAGAFWAAYPHIDWYRIFNAKTAIARHEAGPAIAVFAICFIVAIPAGIVQRIQMALQKGFIANLWSVGGSVIALAGVVIAIRAEAGLPWLVLAFMSGPLAANIANSLLYFGFVRRDIAPRLASAHLKAAVEVMHAGLLFLMLQVAAALTYSSASVIIAQMLGAAEVATYAVPERLFGIVTLVTSMALQPLWPAYREAIVRGDSAWVRRTLRTSLIVSILVASSMSLPLVLLMPTIMHYWLGSAVVSPPLPLIIGFGVWKVIEAGGISLAMFLNGAHIVAAQAVLATLTAIVSILSTIALVHYVGMSGSIWGVVIAFTLCSALPYSFMVSRFIAPD